MRGSSSHCLWEGQSTLTMLLGQLENGSKLVPGPTVLRTTSRGTLGRSLARNPGFRGGGRAPCNAACQLGGSNLNVPVRFLAAASAAADKNDVVGCPSNSSTNWLATTGWRLWMVGKQSFQLDQQAGSLTRNADLKPAPPKTSGMDAAPRTSASCSTGRAPCRRRTGAAVLRADNFGDLTTADHIVLGESCKSRNNHRCALVVPNLATHWIQSRPCRTKLLRKHRGGTRLEAQSHLH